MTDTETTDDGHRPPDIRPGPLGRLAGAAFRRRGRVLVAWAVALAAAVGLSAAFGGEFTADYATSGSDSKQAQDLLTERFPAQSGEPVDVVVHAEDVTETAVRGEVTTLLDELAALPHVTATEDPYAAPGAISADGQNLLARLNLDVANAEDMPIEDTETMLEVAEAAERSGLEIALGGETIRLAEAGEFGSEMVGLFAAAIILLVTFGSVVAAGLPIGVALAGLAVSASLTGVVTAAFDVPDWSPILASLLGIALGIDYVLLMVTRFREWRIAGLEPEAATVATLDTAGRSVLIAGATVMVSMLGLFAMGLAYMRGAAMVTIVAVLTVIAAATTLFPALLGYVGRHVDRLRLPLTRRGAVRLAAGGHVEPGAGWQRWSRWIERHSRIAVVGSAALLLLLAAPFLGARFGFPDAGNDPAGNSSRQAYDMVSDGFGDGANGPLLVVADLASAADETAAQETLDQLTTSLDATAGVAAVTPPQLNPAGDAALITVVPTSGPQAAATEDLARDLRTDVIPAVTDATGTDVHVGGVTAAVIDSNAAMADRLPLLIGGVVAVSMLLLLLAFRSVAIPLTAAAMNLLSVAAAYGMVALVLEGGWAGRLIGIDAEAPMPAFVPVTMFAVLFGLSMDYEVFLISRMRESWVRTKDNGRAIVDGLAGTGRVITAAAAIMVAVFAALVPNPDVVMKAMGVGMASAILIDATLVRMLLVPAAMHVLGRANWWAPAAVERRLPQLYVEGRPELFLHTAEPQPEPAGASTR